MRVRGLLIAIVLMVLPLVVRAQPIEGLYISSGIGYNIAQTPRITPISPGFGASHLRLEQNGGFNGLGSIGYALGNGFRFEIEGDYQRNGISELGRTPFPTAASGHVSRYGAMGNALFDMDIGSRYVFPYIGMGIGYMWTHINGSFVQPGGPFSFATDTAKGRFAWQGIVGSSFPVPGMPGLSLTAEYRFMDITGGADFTGTETTATGTIPGKVELGAQFVHSLMFGVRYAFHVTPPAAPPAPAPVAAPAPAPARSYLVFFDWDKATLTDRARQIIRAAADNSTHVQYTRILVNGYTDTSGSPRYNVRLSIRRAQAVAAELVRDGVPRSAISIHGYGETHLLVATGPGVREPQNRRVEIVIQ
jgi:OmpA-OmpF porin, OOP family